jgi:hypothetical protein
MAMGNGSPTHQFDPQEIWALKAELSRLRDFQTWQQANTDEDFARLELRVKTTEDRFERIQDNINAAIRWLGIGAAAIIFELLRKGVVF